MRIALGSKPRSRNSWAVDAEFDERRQWTAPAGAPGEHEVITDTLPRIFAPFGAGVEGKSNPAEDLRGHVARRRTMDRRQIPGLGRVDLSRCRDGIAVGLELEESARVYGLGERTGWLDKRGRTWAFWNSDDPEHLPDKDPLYLSVTVAYIVTGSGVTSIVSDSPATQYFDIGESDPTRFSIEAYDEQLDLYVRHDETITQAVTAVTGLTGRTPLPPEWALGYQQCRYSYYPDTRVLEVARGLRRRQIPCDAIVLDIHYMDGYRVFTWDHRRFPRPERMIAELRSMGMRTVAIVDPGVKVDPEWNVFMDGRASEAFLTRPDGRPYIGEVWPGPAVFPDTTSEGGRSWWAEQHAPLLETGVAGIWNDMNEPADFSGDEYFRPAFTVPSTLVCDNDGDATSMARVHNIYANGLNEATRRALGQFRPEERGFVLTRAGYTGIQRYAAVWTGDNHAWWEHLQQMVPMLLNLSLSGVGFCGADVGGFQRNATPELYARWIAAAAFTPFFRGHSALDTLDHEPWSFGERILDVARTAIRLRYSLLPYLYTLFHQMAETGAPVMRPLLYEFPHDATVGNRADSFMLGSALLVAPVTQPGVAERAVYLPAGLWYDAWSGDAIEAGESGTTVVAAAPLERIPLFVRGGTIVPCERPRSHTGQSGDGTLRLLVAPDRSGRAEGTLYADRGEGWEYLGGQWAQAHQSYDGRTLSGTIEGSMAHTRWEAAAVHLLAPEAPASDALLADPPAAASAELPDSGAFKLSVT